MKCVVLALTLSCLFAVPIFADFFIEVPVHGQCLCTGGCMINPETGTFVGDCSETVTCYPLDCQGNGVCLRTEYIIQQTMQLVYNGINRNEFDISLTGMMAATEGTFPDYEEIYVISAAIPLTNEIKIVSQWCKEK